MTLTAKALEEIKARAAAATPGPWDCEICESGSVLAKDDHSLGTVYGSSAGLPHERRHWPHAANAAHIAGMDPATTLALIKAFEDSDAEIERLREALKSQAAWVKHWIADYEAGLKPTLGSLTEATAEIASAMDGGA